MFLFQKAHVDALHDAKTYTCSCLSHQVLSQFDTDCQGWIHKQSLRGLLFTYAFPVRPDEFDQLWLG